MGRKKMNEAEKKKRMVLYVKAKHIKKVKPLIIKTIQDHERSIDTEKN